MICPCAHFSLRHFILEKVVFMFVVAFASPMLGSHFPAAKGHNVLTGHGGDIQGAWCAKKTELARRVALNTPSKLAPHNWTRFPISAQ